MHVLRLYVRNAPDDRDKVSRYAPSVHSLTCLECSALCIAVIYAVPGGARLALLRSNYGGLATPNTPAGVAYYLDQAARAQSVGANSAALVMYRAALEHLMLHLGFPENRLADKIKELERQRQQPAAPKWMRDLEPEDLTILARLGNGAIHTNGGDISKQDAIDHDMVVAVMLTFARILEDAIERDLADKDRREKLRTATTLLR